MSTSRGRSLSPATSPALSPLKRYLGIPAVIGMASVALLTLVVASPPGSPSRVLPSAVVLPPPTIPLRFSHAKHPPSDFKCTQCHVQAPQSTRSRDLLLPKKKACLGCHDEAKVPTGFGTPGNRNIKKCKWCHLRFNPNGFPQRVQWPRPRLRFSHKLHLDRKTACGRCHQGVAHAGYGGGLHLPKMATCLGCHNGTQGASARCATCHLRNASGRLRIRFPEGSLKPGPSLPNLQHGPTFRRSHKVAARGHRKACDQCHQRATCLRCHGGIRKPASIHLGNYILRHGRDARANRQRCKSCHTRDRFCQSCHNRVGVARSNSKSPYRSPGVRRFHGRSWASSTSRGQAANRHAVHARRNVGTCVSCHRERDCTRCHARRRRGGLGYSPHRPGFRTSRRCKVLLRKNRRSCLKCHGFNDPLMTLCR